MPRFIRRAFNWKQAIWFIPFCLASGFGAAFADQFALAHLFNVLWWIYSLVCWLASDTLAAKLQRSLVYLADGSLPPPSKKRYRIWQIIPSVFLVVAFFAAGYWIRTVQRAKQLGSLDEWLRPGSAPAPPSACNSSAPLPPDAVAIYLGNSRLATGGNPFPWAVIVPQDRRIRKPILAIERDEEGRIAIDLDVRGKDGRIIARLVRNHFVVNRNNILSKSSPDESTLIVTNEEGNDVLTLKYLNPRMIHLLGTFYVVGQNEPIVITEDEQDMGGRRMVLSNLCNTYGEGMTVSISSGGDGSGNHEYDAPASRQHPWPAIKWNKSTQQWE